MAVVLEHWNCMECDCDEFHVVLKGKGFGKAKIAKVICRKCGTIYANEKEAKK